MDKLFLIIITHVMNVNVTQLKTFIGFDKLSAGSEVSFFDAQLVNRGMFYGTYQDNIIIISNKLSLSFYYKDPSEFEKQLLLYAPKSDITVLTLDDRNSFYGYALIKDGVRQRVKAGTDTEVFVDVGKNLNEEDVLLQSNLIPADELDAMKKEHDANYVNKQIEYEVGKRIPIKLLTRFFGNNIDEVAETLNKILLIEYQ